MMALEEKFDLQLDEEGENIECRFHFYKETSHLTLVLCRC